MKDIDFTELIKKWEKRTEFFDRMALMEPEQAREYRLVASVTHDCLLELEELLSAPLD